MFVEVYSREAQFQIEFEFQAVNLARLQTSCIL